MHGVDTNILIEAFGLSVLQVDYVRGLGINELKVANSINDYCVRATLVLGASDILDILRTMFPS